MRKLLGIILLLLAAAAVVTPMVVMYGWHLTILSWVTGIVITLLVLFGIMLLSE